MLEAISWPRRKSAKVKDLTQRKEMVSEFQSYPAVAYVMLRITIFPAFGLSDSETNKVKGQSPLAGEMNGLQSPWE